MKGKVYDKFSKNILSDIVRFFSWKEGFNKYRLINKKHYQCFEQYLIQIVTEVPTFLKQYSAEQITEAKEEIKNNLTIVERINTLGATLRQISANSDNLTEEKMYSALRLIKTHGEYKVKSDDKGMPMFKSKPKFDDRIY